MWGFIIDHLGLIIIGGGMGIALLMGMIQRFRERKYGPGNEKTDVPGTAGKVMGYAVFRGLPTDITGMPPSGHFRKPDFSYDEEQEMAYAEKYEEADKESEVQVMKKEVFHDANALFDANEPKIPKWFLIYEGIYILICAICKFFIEANVMYESILMGVLSVISMAFVITQIIMRKKRGFRSFMTNLFIMGSVTVAVMIWCIEGFV